MNELRNLILALSQKNQNEGCSSLDVKAFCTEALELLERAVPSSTVADMLKKATAPTQSSPPPLLDEENQ